MVSYPEEVSAFDQFLESILGKDDDELEKVKLLGKDYLWYKEVVVFEVLFLHNRLPSVPCDCLLCALNTPANRLAQVPGKPYIFRLDIKFH